MAIDSRPIVCKLCQPQQNVVRRTNVGREDGEPGVNDLVTL